MSVYLLTWNPKHFSTGDGKDELPTLAYLPNEIVRWSCHSQQLKIGDTVYLVRLGLEPRGIVAKGTVCKESYLDQHWLDSDQKKRYIDFRLDSYRENCEQGLLAMMLLQAAMPEQIWSPQTSGIQIRPEYHFPLAELWDAGEGKHSLALYFTWYLTEKFDHNGWYKEYVAACQLAKKIKASRDITAEDVKKLWFDSSNGIAGVGQGSMYKRELEENQDYLQQLTLQILQQPNEETYQHLIKDWKLTGTFNRVLWGVIHRVFAAAAPDKFTSVVANEYIKDIFGCLNNQYQIGATLQDNWLADNRELLGSTQAYLPAKLDDQTRNILLWSLSQWKTAQNSEANIVQTQGRQAINPSQSEPISMQQPLNQIFYGPPGTGKTYHTIEAAVKAAEPNYFQSLRIDASKGAALPQRSELQRKYRELVDVGRIQFVTFHQSYGYEEFVEGLTATSNEGQITYEIKSGIFKKICEQASRGVEFKNDPLETAIAALKMDLEDGTALSLQTQRGKAFDIQYHGNTTFRAFPRESSNEELVKGYPVAIDSIRKLYHATNANEVYNSSYVKAILKHLISNYSLPEHPITNEYNVKNFVLIIDEINRGNISKIFGELITLLEVSKRSGVEQNEAIEVVLPYSGDSFSVPSNLYIIGTMNTADRSLAMMDTALRRRFDFKEMMPKSELLAGIKVKGIDLQCLLDVLNQRIEILYDREHTLGHAFFMPVKTLVDEEKQERAFESLVSIFKNKIIPLLEEYFFEDWSKLRLVLADNQKARPLQFIYEDTKTNQSLNELFGTRHNLDQYGQTIIKYTLAEDTAEVWSDPKAYIGIYQKISEIHDSETEKDR